MQNQESTTRFKLPEERRQQIATILASEGKVYALELSQRLAVSEDTIRRDLRDMDRAGLLTRVHGGALPKSPSEVPFLERRDKDSKKKESIAREAAKLAEPGQVIFIDGGSTCADVAKNLPIDLVATVVTISPPAAMALELHKNLEVILLGGQLDMTAMTVSGSFTRDAISRVRADLCYLGICSVHDEVGVTAISFEEAELKRVMIENSATVVATTTSEKIGTATAFCVSPIDSIDHIVTDKSLSDSVLDAYVKAGVSVSKV